MTTANPKPLAAAVATMLATYALVIMASLTLPVTAPLAEGCLDVPARYIGLYAAIMYAAAAASSLIAANLTIRYGALRTSQGTLLFAAAGLCALAGGHIVLAALSAVLIGFAYGPGNTASGRLLTAMTAEGRRSGVFSIKQTSVPLGGALCGLIMPALALRIGWQEAALAMALFCLLAAFAVQPWRAALDGDRDPGHAPMPRRLVAPVATVMKGPRLRALGIAGLVYSGMQYAFGTVLVAFLVERAGVGAVEAGLILSAAMAASVVARMGWGYVADWTRAEAVLGLIGLLTAGSVITAMFVDTGWSRAALVALGCWFGAAGFSWNGVYLALVADIAGAKRVADATSGVMTLVFLGSLAFPALFTGLLAASGYDLALLTVAIANAITAIYLFVTLNRARRSDKV